MGTSGGPTGCAKSTRSSRTRAVIEVVARAREKRWPQSRRRGRLGTPADVVIRMLILKHLFDWSYDDLEHEVRAKLLRADHAGADRLARFEREVQLTSQLTHSNTVSFIRPVESGRPA